MAKITKVHYDVEGGGIMEVALDDQRIVSIHDAIEMCKAGELEDVNVGADRNGFETLRGNPDGDPLNNLSNLPRF